jgi:beta-fructofuranosidase
MVYPLLLLLISAVVNPTADISLHAAALADANAAVERAASLAVGDPLRPIYHVTSAGSFINDPNGPVYFKGEYHVFFQHLPYWSENPERSLPMWGHAVSPDLIHWTHLPIALAPVPNTYDEAGIASGCCVINNGEPTIIYTGVGKGLQTQCLAVSGDNMRTWSKDSANPVIPYRPALEGLGDGFRDPCAWREGDEWRLLAGSGFENRGGTVLLYRSMDLRHWEFLGPMCEGMGPNCFQWECPTFFPLGDRSVLIVSPLYHDAPGLRGMVEYAVGTYKDNHFEPDCWRPVDLGGPTVYYAPNSFEDSRGRRILWGWVMAGRPETMGWSHCLSLPRIVTLGEDGALRYEPASELTALRENERSRKEQILNADNEIILEPALGLHGEIDAEIELGAATRVELRAGRALDGKTTAIVAYDDVAAKLFFADKQADFKLAPGETSLRLRLFLDGCVGEAYVNNRACFTNIVSVDESATGVSILASGGAAKIKNISFWGMKSIWTK